MKNVFTCFLIALLIPVNGVLAQNINLLPEGQTLVTLTVTERVKVSQDLLVASLRIESEDRDPQVLQDRINTLMDRGLGIARATSGVKVATGFYSVYQFSNQPQGGRPDSVWRGTQSLTLESGDAAALLTLAGELQGMGYVMNQLSYQLSPERADEVRDSLLELAIERAAEKVRRAGAALGRTDVDIAVLDIDSSLNYDSPMMLRTGMAAEMSAPVAEAGESEVTLTVRIQAVAR
jgi:predicted secreted protein